MQGKGALALGIVVVTVGVWTACVGTDTAPTNTPPGKGAQNQPCFENQTCLVGLDCVNGTCVVGEAGAGTSSGTSGSGTSSTTTSSGSSGTRGGTSGNVTNAKWDNCGLLTESNHVTCPSDQQTEVECSTANRFCCPGTGCLPDDLECGSNEGPFECLSTGQCATDKLGICCVPATVIDSTDCGRDHSLKTTNIPRCKNAAQCGFGELELCQTGATCKNGNTCVGASFSFSGVHDEPYLKAVGVCL